MPKRGENIRKRKDGRWEGRFIQGYKPDGKAKYSSVYGKSYLETKKKLVQTIEKRKFEVLPDKCRSVSFREVLFLWLNNSKIKLRPQTYSKYSQMIENHLAETIGSYKIPKVETPLINEFLDEKMKNGRLDKKGGLSTSYVKTLIFIINSAIEFAVTHGYRPPLCGEVNKPAHKKNEYQVFTIEEQNRLERFLLNDMDGTKLEVLICLHTGLRIGEICGLKWSDIDFSYNTLTVRRTVCRITNPDYQPGEAKTKLTIGNPKSVSSYRVIPIASYLISVISEFKKISSSEFVISDHEYTLVDPRTYQYRFHRYLKDCVIKDINFHSLRHTFATRCIEVGVDIKSLSEILGHASVNITLNIYVHSSLDRKRSQIELLGVVRGQEKGQKTA